MALHLIKTNNFVRNLLKFIYLFEFIFFKRLSNHLVHLNASPFCDCKVHSDLLPTNRWPMDRTKYLDFFKGYLLILLLHHNCNHNIMISIDFLILWPCTEITRPTTWIPEMLGHFFNLNKIKTKSLSNHMSQYFIHNRTCLFSTKKNLIHKRPSFESSLFSLGFK